MDTAFELMDEHTLSAECERCGGTGHKLKQIALGGSLKALREKRDLSQKQMAEFMGIGQPFLCDLEFGRRQWTKDLVERYLKSCNGK